MLKGLQHKVSASCGHLRVNIIFSLETKPALKADGVQFHHWVITSDDKLCRHKPEIAHTLNVVVQLVIPGRKTIFWIVRENQLKTCRTFY